MSDISYNPFNDVTDPDAVVDALNVSLASLYPPSALNPIATLNELAAINTMNTARLLGRFTAGVGIVEEITIGANLTLSGAGVLSATGGGGGITSLNALVAAAQTFVDDTNVTIVSAVSTHTITWLGQLSIARGGTNSGAALASNRIMVSVAGAIVEDSAHASGQIAFYSATGLPSGSTLFKYNSATDRMSIGTVSTSSYRLNVIGGAGDLGLNVTSVALAGEFTSSGTGRTLDVRNSNAITTPIDSINLIKTISAPTIGSGQYIRWDDQIAGPSTENVGRFGVLMTDATALTYKTKFVWQTPNETTGTLADRMSLSSRGILEIYNPIGTLYNEGFLSGATADSNTVTGAAELPFTTNGCTFVVPANSLQVGSRIRVNFKGRFSTPALAQTLIFRFKTGATVILATAARTMVLSATNRGFTGDVIMRVVSIGAGGTVMAGMTVLYQKTNAFSDGYITPNITDKAFNTTVANTLQFSAQWSTANAGNLITLEDTYFEILKP